MPELPEVEAVCRKLRADGAGRRIVQARIERAGITRPQSASWIEEAMTGRRMETVERRGKNILLHLDGDLVAHIHLRMTGNLYVVPDVRFRPVAARAWWELEGGKGLIFEDPRALGRVHVHRAEALDALFAGVGVEPLADAFTVEHLRARAKGCRKPAKLFLMDQKHVAGLGNIYAAEALFRAGIHPARGIGGISAARIASLHAAIREVMHEAVASAVLAYAAPGRFAEAGSFDTAVYDREGGPCRRCGRKIRRIPQGGRSTYFCPGCQR